MAGPPSRYERALTPGLLALVVGIYGLVMTGAVASLADAAATCASWPACEGARTAALADPSAAVAVGHRLATAAVFVLLVGVTVLARLASAPRRVIVALGAVLLLYPLQVAIGALTAVTGGSAALAGVHLLVAMAIFAGALVAFLLWLEWDTRGVESAFDTTADTAVAVPPADNPPAGRLRAYLEMTKPRLMWLLSVVAIAGIGLAAATTGTAASLEVVVGTLVGGILAIGASGTFNHVLERDIDRRMARTAGRPLPTAAVPARNALAFGAGLAVAAVAVFLWLTNPLAAGLGLVAIGFYSVIYTVVLKPNTPQNIVIGGAVGAFPAVIGWAAVTGSIGLPAVVLGLVIFLWTPAHFYNLALVHKRDYARGGFPMLPLVRGEHVTRRHILLYAGATLLGVGLLGATAELGWLFGTTAVVAGGGFLLAIVHLYEQQTPAAAMRTFHASNAFLGVLMVVIVLETLIL